MKITNFGKRKVKFVVGDKLVNEGMLKALYNAGEIKAEETVDVYIDGRRREQLKVSDIYD